MEGHNRARQRLAGISRVDVLLVLALLVIGQQEVWAPTPSVGAGGFSHGGPDTVLSVTYALASLALLWRRRAPLATAFVVNGLLAAHFLVFGSADGLGSFLPAVCAVYAAGRWGRRDGFWLAVAATALQTVVHEWRDPHFTLAGPAPAFWTVLLAAGLVGRALAIRAHQLDEAANRAEQLRAHSAEQERQAVGAERTRIARELHDLVGHGLTLLVLQLVAAQSELERGDTARIVERLGWMETTARNTLAETRRLVTVMGEDHPDLAPQPGIDDLAPLVEDVRATGLPVTLHVDDRLEGTPEGVGLAVYRLVQEALTNVARHAVGARRVEVAVRRTADGVAVEVVDDGSHHAVAGRVDRRSDGGQGLIGMRERIDLYGGTLTTGPEPERGFAVRAIIPLEPAGRPAKAIR